MARIEDPTLAGVRGANVRNVGNGGNPLTGPFDQNIPVTPWDFYSPWGTAQRGPSNYLESMAQPATQPQIDAANQAAGGVAAPLTPPATPGVNIGFTPWLMTPDGKKYLQALENNRQAFRKQQEGVIAQNQGALQGYREIPQQLDLSPLIALADRWTEGGGNVSAGYAKPVPIEQRIATMQALERAVQDANMGLTKGDLAYLKEFADTKDKADMMRLQAELAAAKRTEAQAAKGQVDAFKLGKEKVRAGEAYNKDMGVKIRGLAEVSGDINLIKSILSKTGNKIPESGTPDFEQFRGAQSRIITGINKYFADLGALAGADKALLDLQAAVRTGRFEMYWNQFLSGGDLSGMLKVLDTIEKSSDKMVDRAGKLTNKIWNIDGTPLADDVYQIDRESYYATKAKQGESGPKQIDYNALSDEELDAKLRAIGAGM